MKSIFKLTFTLGILAMVVSLAVAIVYIGTKDTIQQKENLQRTEAIMSVLPGMEKLEEITSAGTLPEDKIYQGFDVDGNLIGYAVMGSSNGYGGPIKVMVGVSTDKSEILAIKIVGHQETPGLGDRINEIKSNKTIYKVIFDRENLKEDPTTPWFCEQFQRKVFNQLEIVKQKGSDKIDAITGATVSSTAVVEAVKDAMNKLK